MALRIPAWCSLQHVKLAVNGEAVHVNATGWQVIEREWQAGDRITLELDMRARLVELNQHQAILRGPVLFARDSRFGDGDVDETSVVQAKEGYVEITPAEVPDYAWMSFTAPLILGTDLEDHGAPSQIRFCDFSSAGNTWDKAIRYRVWLPKTLNVMNAPYKPYNY